MRIHSLVFTILLSMASVGAIQAQTTSNEVELLLPDLKRIEVLTYESVNGLRAEVKKPDLVWDDVLYRAAKDHADYLIKEKNISHYQKKAGKRTPAERVKVHGGTIYKVTGENIVEVPLGVLLSIKGLKRSTVTYESSAHTMAQAWKASPGHYKNIISEKYNATALAVAYDSLSQRLVAVQVFGYSDIPSSAVSLPDHSAVLINAPQPKLPYKLKPYRYKPKNQKAVTKFLKMKTDHGYLSGSYKDAKKVFRGRRSGIVQEYIPLSQFDSASYEFSMVPNRRNALFELNGTLYRPVYRRELLKYSRKHTKREYYINTWLLSIKKPARHFRYPLQPNGIGYEYNLFLIKNKRLTAYRSYMMVPGEFFDVPFPKLEIANSFKPLEIKDGYKTYSKLDTAQFQIFYPSAKVHIPDVKQRELLDSLNKFPGKIVAVEAAAFASVEGHKASNDQLATDRMLQFMKLIKPYLDTVRVQPQVQSLEQWKMFSKQLENTRLAPLKKMSIEEVRQYVNENKTDTLLSRLLDEQRYINIKLVWRQDFKEFINPKRGVHLFDSLKAKVFSRLKPSKSLLDSLEQAQLAVYDELSQAVANQHDLPNVAGLERYPAFKYHELVFKYTVLKNIDDESFYKELHRLAQLKNFPHHLHSQLVYNNLVLIYQHYQNGTLDKLMNPDELYCFKYRQSQFYLKRFKNLKCRKFNKEVLQETEFYLLNDLPAFIQRGKAELGAGFPTEELWQYYYLNSIQFWYGPPPLHGKIPGLLRGFKQYFHPDNTALDEEERLRLAYFYCKLFNYSTAKELLAPIATREEPNQEALKLYLVLTYDDFKNEHDYANMLIEEFPRLGKDEWCDLWVNPNYLNFLLLEDLKLKNFYNCNCQN